MEPFKIKMIEHIKITTKKERIKTLQNCKYNLFNIPSNLVMIHLLTDSCTGAMSDEQWSAIMTGDESYANSKSFENLKKVIHELFGKNIMGSNTFLKRLYVALDFSLYFHVLLIKYSCFQPPGLRMALSIRICHWEFDSEGLRV